MRYESHVAIQNTGSAPESSVGELDGSSPLTDSDPGVIFEIVRSLWRPILDFSTTDSLSKSRRARVITNTDVDDAGLVC